MTPLLLKQLTITPHFSTLRLVTDPNTPSPTAAKALQRLQKLAEGNGIAPNDIQLYVTEENTYTVEGTLTLSPLFESTGGRRAGASSGRERKTFSSAAAMKNEIQNLKKAFETKHTWITEAIAQLKEQPAGGWGLDDVKISLPNESYTLAATESCPTCQGNKSLTCQQCHGQGSTVCTHCHGNRQEICHICLGSGTNPHLPNQPCLECNGLQYVPCRFCHGNGHLTCPTCHGTRGTTCSTCNGAGIFTEEVNILCGARTKFNIKADGLPSGLRRGLDRLGMANLAKGHADIEPLAPAPDEESDGTQSAPPMSGTKAEIKKEKGPKPEIHYLAHIPYADLRMGFPGKKAVVGVFGKLQVLLGVPPFLDTALEDTRAKLKMAAKGSGNLEDILTMRVMRDAMKLQLASRGTVKELRRIYPQGLSPKTAEEILSHMRLALNRLTLTSRSIVASLCAVAGSGIFAGIYQTSLRSDIAQGWKPAIGAAFDLGVLITVQTACWFALSIAIRFVLQKRFPEFTIPVTQKTGKTGITMLTALFLAFIATLSVAPQKVEWILFFLNITKV